MKRSLYLRDITIIQICVPNDKGPKIHDKKKHKIEAKKIHNLTTVEDLNIPLSKMTR